MSLRTVPSRNWLIGGGVGLVALAAGVVLVMVVGPALWAAATQPEPVPTRVSAWPTFTATIPPSSLPPTAPSALGVLAGRVWQDLCPPGSEASSACQVDSFGRISGNGTFEEGELGLGGVNVKLGAGPCPAQGLGEVRTGPDGRFRFDTLSPGTYCVSIDPTESTTLSAGGWTAPAQPSDPGGRVFLTTAVAAGTSNPDLGFGWDDTLPGTPTVTTTPTATQSPLATPSHTPTLRPTSTRTVSAAPSATRTRTMTPTATVTPTLTATATPTAIPRGIAIRAVAGTASAPPGTAALFTLVITNTGAATDSFTLTIAGAYPGVLSPATISSLAVNATTQVTALVSVPAGAAAGTTSTSVVTATSQGQPATTAAVTLTTTVAAVYGVQASASPAVRSGNPGAVVTHTLTVTNSGNATDSFSVVLTGTYPATANTSALAGLAKGASAPLTVTVDVPADAAAGASDPLTVTVISAGSPAARAAVVVTTQASQVAAVSVTAAQASLNAGAPPSVLTYTLTLTNSGNGSDTFSIGLLNTDALTVTSSPSGSTGAVAAGGVLPLLVRIEVPAWATSPLTSTTTLTLTSAFSAAVKSVLYLTTLIP